MISVIICSSKGAIGNSLRQNIDYTIGVPYELIQIDNHEGAYSIFQAYRLGGQKAKYPNLVFIHEDIMFRVRAWGKYLCKALSDTSVGLVGVVGSTILFPAYYGWWEGGIVGNVIQNYRENTVVEGIYDYKVSGIIDNAVVCDGLFLALRKDMFNIINWDTKTFSGFHCYDIDICMQVITAGYQIKIIDILIEHYSEGNLDHSFTESCIKFNQKWKNHLPCVLDSSVHTQIDAHIQSVIKEREFYQKYRYLINGKFNSAIRFMMKIKELSWKIKQLLTSRNPYFIRNQVK